VKDGIFSFLFEFEREFSYDIRTSRCGNPEIEIPIIMEEASYS